MESEPERGILEELKRRKVMRVAFVYLAAAFASLEVADLLFPALGVPDWGLSLVIGLAAVGFPVALGLAWAFEVTPGGVRLQGQAEPGSAATWLSPRSVASALVLVVVAGGAGFFLGGAGDGADGSAGPTDASIAVLPFTNTSGDPADAGFTNGLHDDLLTHLSRIGSMRVISRTSVMAYRDTDLTLPEIARELGVSAILEGGVQRSGNQIRVNAQLIDARSDEHLWAEIYDERISVESLLGIQAAIARRIAESLRTTFTADDESILRAQHTENAEAYEFYLRGNEAMRRFQVAYDLGALEEATGAYRSALQLDPEFAAAAARLAYAISGDPDLSDSVRALAGSALARDSALVPAHLALAGAHGGARDPGSAARSLAAVDRALALAPNDPDVLYEAGSARLTEGRMEEALDLARRLRVIDPRSILPDEISSFALEAVRRYPEALALMDRDNALLVRTAEDPIWPFSVSRIRVMMALDADTRRALAEVRDFHERFAPTPAEVGRRLASFPELVRDGDFDALLLDLAPDHRDPDRRCTCAWVQAWLHQVRGDSVQARRLWGVEAERRLSARDRPATWTGEATFRAATAVALARAGRGDEALAELEAALALSDELFPQTRTTLRAQRARVAAALGDADIALTELDFLLAAPGTWSVGRVRVSPVWDGLRSDARFQDILERHERAPSRLP